MNSQTSRPKTYSPSSQQRVKHRNSQFITRNSQFTTRNSPFVLLLLAILLLALSACASATPDEPTPPTIYYGESLCEFCGMIISDERHAAGYLTEAGQERIFDDVAGMFQAHLEQQEEVAAFFVHDYEDVRWIRAETAHYVLSDDLPTPMLSGLVACRSAERAQALAAESDGTVLTFEETLAHFQAAPPAAESHSSHMH